MGRAGPRCQAGAPPAEGWRCRHARARVDWSGRGRLPPAVHRARSDMADERRTAAHEMFEADLASRALGIELLSAGGGRAVVRMRVTVSMVNGHAIAHGGYDVTVMRGDEVVAEFRGHSRTIGRQDA